MARILEDTENSVKNVADLSTVDLNRSGATALKGIRVFDIGQGDCIGLLDQDDNVFCYVDYGGLLNHPDQASTVNDPAASRLPEQLHGKHLQIVLTHWDKDHYYSAKRYNTGAQQCPWLVPRQMASPQAVRFAANLPNALCWPERLKKNTWQFQIDTDSYIEIRKCDAFVANLQKEDRNHTGLVITLLRYVDGNLDRYMLLPGDCPFDRIPNLPQAPIKAMVAYHHGARKDWGASSTTIRSFTTPRSFVYSYGVSNTYGHPDPSNYLPDWDPHSQHTPRLRSGPGFADVTW